MVYRVALSYTELYHVILSYTIFYFVMVMLQATGAVWVDLDEGRVHSNLPKCSQIPILPNLPAMKFLERCVCVWVWVWVWVLCVCAHTCGCS